MRISNRIVLSLMAFFSIAAIVLCGKYNANLGELGYTALVALAGLCILILTIIPIIKFVKNNFTINYDDGALKVSEQDKKDMGECK